MADDAGATFLTGSVARQVSAARRSDRPVCHRAAGRSGLPRRRAAQGQARDHHSGRRDRRPQRPGAARRPGRPHPDLFGLRRRRGRRHDPRQRDGDAATSGCSPSTSASAPPSRRRRRRARRKPPPSPRPRRSRSPPQQAEMVTLAQTLGTLSLVLNSVRDGGDDDAGGAASSPAPASSPLGAPGRQGRGSGAAPAPP